MKYRKFGKTGWDISEIGFGGWGIGKAWWGGADDIESIEALKAAVEQGINFFDTAYVYGDGHSEELMGQALKGKQVYIATKIPPKNHEWPGNPETPVKETFPKDWILRCTDRSLQKLGRDTIDLTQFHCWTDAWLNDDGWKDAVAALKLSGKIRAFGVSINDHDPNSAIELVKSGLVDSVQVIFNIFDQSPVQTLFPLCLKHKVGVIVRVPLDEGGLTGTLTKDTHFSGDDFRAHYFRGDNLIQTVARVERLKPLVGSEAKTLPELALKFILAYEAVSTVIPGMRRKTNVMANAAVSGTLPLSENTITTLRAHAWKRNFYQGWE